MTSDTQPTENQSKLFQAIGIIIGKVSYDSENNRAFVKIQQKEYPLKYVPTKVGQKAWDALKLELSKNGERELRLTVYPQALHFPMRDKQHIIFFSLVGFGPVDREKSSEKHNFEAEDFEFKLCGLWQFIPVCKTPCVSIMRNFHEDIKAKVKNMDSLHRVRFMKAQHLPLLWKDAIVPPFRFNPKVEKEQQGKRYFVEIKTRFLPGKDVFGFESIIGMPTEELPPHFKPGKALKAEVMQIKKEQKKAKAEAAKNTGGTEDKPLTEVSKPKPIPKKKDTTQ